MRYSYFTDIEEVVKWTYDYSERFYDKNNPDTANFDTLGTTGTANNIRKMKSYPNDEILKEVNVEEIYIAESLSCINNVKDATCPSHTKDLFAPYEQYSKKDCTEVVGTYSCWDYCLPDAISMVKKFLLSKQKIVPISMQ